MTTLLEKAIKIDENAELVFRLTEKLCHSNADTMLVNRELRRVLAVLVKRAGGEIVLSDTELLTLRDWEPIIEVRKNPGQREIVVAIGGYNQ